MRFSDLDGVRGTLAIVVMLYHFGLDTIVERITLGLVPRAPWGACVDLFFLLSGFVLCHSLTQSPRSIFAFFLRRCIRLLPIHLVIIIVFFYPLISHTPMETETFLINLILLQPILFLTSINGPSWSAGFELYFSILLFPLISFWRSRPVSIDIAIAFVMLILGQYTSYQLADGTNLNWLRAISGLLLGMCLYNIAIKMGHQRTPRWKSWVLPSMLLIFMLLVTLSGIWRWLAIVFPVVSGSIVLVGFRSKSILSWQPFRFLGDISYPLYLVHIPILLFGLQISHESIEGSFMAKTSLIVLACIFATLLHIFVEMPVLSHRFFYPQWRKN